MMFFILCIFPLWLYAQNKAVRGVVTDNQGTPLPGVTIRVQGMNLGTMTDMNGQFTLSNV